MIKNKDNFIQEKKSVLIVSIVLSMALVVYFLWSCQYVNIRSLEQKIKYFQINISQFQSVDEKLKLEKDILVIEKDKVIIQNGVYSTIVQALGGMALLTTAWIGYSNFKIGEKNLEVTQKNLKVSEEKQVTERFSKAIEHLGNQEIAIRVGGIYALEQIATDSPDKYHWTIVEILSAFVREKSNQVASNIAESNDNLSSDLENTLQRVKLDIQVAIYVLGRRNIERDPKGKVVDLKGAKLEKIDMEKANFSKAILGDANLTGANLTMANLSEAYLTGTILKNAVLHGANLHRATIINANMNRANLSSAQAVFLGVRMFDSDPDGADLSGATIINVDMSGADFTGVNLTNADISGVDLREARNLTWKQVKSTASHSTDNLPDYLNVNPPSHSPQQHPTP